MTWKVSLVGLFRKVHLWFYEYDLVLLNSLVPFVGYYKDEEAFLKRVEEDATIFKPLGQLIYSYTRPSPNSSSKGKRKRTGNTKPLDPGSEDAVEFEVYHVSLPGYTFMCNTNLQPTSWLPRLPGIHQASVNTIAKCNSLSFCTLKEVPTLTRKKIHGSSWFCKLDSSLTIE